MEDEFVQRVSVIARALSRRFRSVSLGDIQQELWAWLFGHMEAIERWEGQEESWRTQRALWSAGSAYCQKEKAAIEGYSPEDVYYYSVNHIQNVLEDAFAALGEPKFLGVHAHVWDADSTIDVVGAYEKASEYDRKLIWDVLSSDGANPARVVALARGQTEDLIRGRYRRALRRLQRSLGGPNPTAHQRVDIR